MSSIDLNLLYSGGSGGFLLLHLLLLSDKYMSKFNTHYNLTQIVDRQWSVVDPTKWKSTEIWPDNNTTHRATSQLETNKIYFYCNPTADLQLYSNFNLVLYTDYESQIKLAFYKKAHWFNRRPQSSQNRKFSAYRTLLNNWQIHYNNIKDPSWPSCVSFRKIKNLPNTIQEQLLNDPTVKYYLDYRYKEEYDLYSGLPVYNVDPIGKYFY